MSDGSSPATQALPHASVVIVSTNELHHLKTLMPSLRALAGGRYEVIVVDNASSDSCHVWLEEYCPWVRIIRSTKQLGFASATNLGFSHATGPYLVALNPDTCVDRDFMRGLIETSKSKNDRALVTSLICLFDEPESVNTYGNLVHFALIASCRGLGEESSRFSREDEVASVSGCAFLVPKAVYDDLGGLDESTFMYLEDTEYSLRAQLYGYSCKTSPGSRITHKYKLKLTPQKFFFIERNRWIVMLRTYRLATLIVLAPGLVTVELLSWAIAFRMGRKFAWAKARSILSLFRFSASIWNSRTTSQRRRVTPDRQLLSVQQGQLPVAQLITGGWLGNAVLQAVNRVFVVYFAIVRLVVRW